MLMASYTQYQFVSPFPVRIENISPGALILIMILGTAFAVYMSWKN